MFVFSHGTGLPPPFHASLHVGCRALLPALQLIFLLHLISQGVALSPPAPWPSQVLWEMEYSPSVILMLGISPRRVFSRPAHTDHSRDSPGWNSLTVSLFAAFPVTQCYSPSNLKDLSLLSVKNCTFCGGHHLIMSTLCPSRAWTQHFSHFQCYKHWRWQVNTHREDGAVSHLRRGKIFFGKKLPPTSKFLPSSLSVVQTNVVKGWE